MEAGDYFQTGDLTQAVTAAISAVKAKPADPAARWLLCEMLCFAGDLDRIDKHLDLIGEQEPKSMPGVSLFRQLLRAAIAREQFYSDGRLPELLGQPPIHVSKCLEAAAHLRVSAAGAAEGAVGARELLTQAESLRPHPQGTHEGKHFDDLRDLDDLTASVFEVLTSTGKYYWIPIERVLELEMQPAKRARDLIWRPARMVVSDGPKGVVYLPALYPGSHLASDAAVRLGRTTNWLGGEGEIVRGSGQKMFLVGDDACGIGDLSNVKIDAQGSAAATGA